MKQKPAKTYETPVVLVGGGTIAWPAFEQVKSLGLPLVAVDGGANPLAARGIEPDLVIGDLDSIDDSRGLRLICQVVEIAEQETTDYEKALYSLQAPLFIAFGFWGRRLDHSLAALHVITKYRTTKRIVMVDQEDLLYLPQGPLTLALPTHTRVSLFPLGAAKFTGSTGLKYPLAGLTLENGTAIGVSNQTSEPEFHISPAPEYAYNYAVILPNSSLRAVLADFLIQT